MTNPWIVIPTYNEKANIGAIIAKIMALSIPNISLLVVDDNSPDNTGKLVAGLKERYQNLHLLTRKQKTGLGGAYVAGFGYALEHGADAVVQMDADFSHDPADVPRLLSALQNHDLVIGSRYCQGISVINWPLKRLLISIGGNMYARFVTGLPIHDLTGGFKAWRAQTLRDLDLSKVSADGYGFQIVMNYRTYRLRKKIQEIPIIFTERRNGQSKMSGTIIWEALGLVWKLRFFG